MHRPAAADFATLNALDIERKFKVFEHE